MDHAVAEQSADGTAARRAECMADDTLSNEDVLKELKEYVDWYERSTAYWGYALFVLRTASVLSGFLVATLTGLTVGHATDQDTIKIWILISSAVGTLATAFLASYKVSEVERLRAEGHIKCRALWLKAKNKLPSLDGSEKVAYVEKAFDEITKVETLQNEGFYAHFSGTNRKK